MFMKAEQNTYGSSRPSGQPSFFFFNIFFCILGTRALNLTDFSYFTKPNLSFHNPALLNLSNLARSVEPCRTLTLFLNNALVNSTHPFPSSYRCLRSMMCFSPRLGCTSTPLRRLTRRPSTRCRCPTGSGSAPKGRDPSYDPCRSRRGQPSKHNLLQGGPCARRLGFVDISSVSG